MRAAIILALLTAPTLLAAAEPRSAKPDEFACTLRIIRREAKDGTAKVWSESKSPARIGKETSVVAGSDVAVPDGETFVGIQVKWKLARLLEDGRIVVDISTTHAREVLRIEERFQIRTVTHRDVAVLKPCETATIPLGDGDALWCEFTCEPEQRTRVTDVPPR